MACSDPPFQRPGAVLMCPHDRRVDHRVFIVGILGQMLEKLLPHSRLGPAAEPRMHHAKIAETFRQFASWNSGSIAIENRLNEQSIVPSWTSYRTLPSRQHTFDPLPLIVP